MRTLISKRAWAWLAMLLTIPLLAIVGTTTTAGADSWDCNNTNGSPTGGGFDGHWTKHYVADNQATCALINIGFHNYEDAQFDNHVTYDIRIETGPIAGDDCVQVALDWAPVAFDHSDAQIMRNCDEFSTQTMTEQDVQINQSNWVANRIQVSVYHSADVAVHTRACPTNTIAPGTDSDGECTGWNPNGVYQTKAAKIRLKLDGQSAVQNDPLWPALYHLSQMTDPNN